MRLSGRKSAFSTRRWTRPKQIVILTLIGINAAVFVMQLLVDSFYPGFVRDYLGISKANVHNACAWQFVSALFLHSGPWHLATNMLVLYLLGRDLDSILGQRHFLYLYLSGAVAGEFGHLFLMPVDSVLLAGSGGVAAVICAYAIILPELELTSSGLFALRPKAKHLGTALWILSIVLLCVDRSPVVVHSALFGGCIAGCLYAHLLGFGAPSSLQRFFRQRRERAERFEHMTIEQLMTEEIDPLLEKIADCGWIGLSKKDRRALLKAREKILRSDY